MNLDELGLTPSQLGELEQLEPSLVEGWLSALEHAQSVRSPVGWFLAGVRSGKAPHADADLDRARAVHLAERYIATAGMFLPSELELVDELFGARGRLRPWIADDALVARMVAFWQARQAAAGAVESERVERADKWRLSRQHLRTERITDGHAPQSEHSSQTNTALTAVSAHTGVLDVDADIAW